MTAVLRLLALVLAALLCVPGAAPLGIAPALAQQPADAAPDFEAWERTATRAEEAVEAARASTPALEVLRAELVKWRQQFQQAQSINAAAIATVERQIAALGPAPAEGTTEAEDIAAQRTQLNERLVQLREPVLAAQLAYNRADGLINAIDRIIRSRQTQEILEFGPSPLNPLHWSEGLRSLKNTVTHIAGELRTGWSNPIQQKSFRGALPLVLLLGAVGLVLLTFGARWSRQLTARVVGPEPGPARWLAGFALSLGSLILPYLGVLALIEAVRLTGMAGLAGSQLLDMLAQAAFLFLVAQWLSTRVFPTEDATRMPLRLDWQQRFEGRLCGKGLGLAIAALYFAGELTYRFGWSAEAKVVILFPIVVISSLLLWRLAALLKAHVRNETSEEAEVTFRARLLRALSIGLLLLAIAAPALMAVGYANLAEAMLVPSIMSLQLLAALFILQRLVIEVYVLVSGSRERASESLLPVLTSFLIVLASTPIFALIWGARETELAELWSTLVNGVTLGGVRISPAVIFTLGLVFFIGLMVTRLVQGVLRNSILPKTRMDPGGRNAVVSGVGYVGIFLAALIAVTSAGIDLSSLAIVAGALSVGIGFGLQNIVSNFVAGIILLIERPISEGDWIEVGGQHGYVKAISVRSTRIETFDRTDVIVPNADFVSGTVTNYTRGNTVGRVIVPVGVAYGSDTRRVEAILREVAEEHPMVLMNPRPVILFQNFGASSLDFEIRAMLRDVNWVASVKSDMNHEIARRFAEEGIEIPFPQRDLWLRNPETLRGETADPAKPPASAAPGAPSAAPAMMTEADVGQGGESDGR
ncbi:MAG: mechanosensitive ion channel protein MscS [Roseovarius sp.]|nr:mechanosensitive ion channel protein MscS [Roseovarius sp.]